MESGSRPPGGTPKDAPKRAPLPLPAPAPPEPLTPAELRALVLGGLNESDVCETLLAQSSRIEAALDLAIGDGLAALSEGDRLIRLGFSCLRDYAREVLDVSERTAEAMARLSRELRTRPLLRAALRAGAVRLRAAQTVLPVAVGEAEAEWVERAHTETVRVLEKAVRAVRAGEDDEEWTRFRVRLSPEERVAVDEALGIAGGLMPGSTRAQRLEAMAQEYLSEHPVEDDAAARGDALARDDRERVERRRAALEADTERWSFLPPAPDIPTPDEGCAFDGMRSAEEIDRALRAVAVTRDGWDRLLGYCAYAVRRSGLWRIAGFESFEHYCAERLGLSARAVEQRAAVERRLWEVPALWAARERGLSYEKVRLLSRLPSREVDAWIPQARELTCVALRAKLDEREEAQMRAARTLRARVPVGIALLLEEAFWAVRADEGCLLDDGKCLLVLAAHFTETWRAHVRRARTLSQRVRERDEWRCQFPGCSRRSGHAHHVDYKSHGGPNEEENLVALCGCHHQRGIHGGWIRVHGRAPDELVWEVCGRVWTGGRIP